MQVVAASSVTVLSRHVKSYWTDFVISANIVSLSKESIYRILTKLVIYNTVFCFVFYPCYTGQQNRQVKICRFIIFYREL